MDHERIWLEPAPGADKECGQMWCQDNVWGDEATEYVRADLARSPADKGLIEALTHIVRYIDTAKDDISRVPEKSEYVLSLLARDVREIAAAALSSVKPEGGES